MGLLVPYTKGPQIALRVSAFTLRTALGHGPLPQTTSHYKLPLLS